MTKVEQQGAIQDALGLIDKTRSGLDQVKARIKRKEEQAASQISDSVKSFAGPLVDQLPHSIIAKIGTFSTPEEDYVHFAIYVPSTHRLLSRLFTINGTLLIYPRTREGEAGDWIELGNDVVTSIERAIEAKKSGIDLTLPVQLSWHPNLPSGLDIPPDLLKRD